MDTLAHRGRLDTEYVSDFSGGELFQITQHKSTPIEIGQSIERGRRFCRQDLPIEQFVGTRGDLQLRWRVTMAAGCVEFRQERFQRFDRSPCASPLSTRSCRSSERSSGRSARIEPNTCRPAMTWTVWVDSIVPPRPTARR